MSSAVGTARFRALARASRARTQIGNPRGKIVEPGDVIPPLQSVIAPGDRVCLEGNNQKQADFLAKALALVDPAHLHDLHLALPEHLDLFEKGIASRLDFSFAGPQSARVAQLVADRRIAIGAIHTYLELFSRYLTTAVVGGCVDAIEEVAQAAHAHGARVQCLAVDVPSRTPLLAGAVAPFRDALDASRLRNPTTPVFAGIDASLVTRRSAAVDVPSRQLTQRIQWARVLPALRERGCRVFLELPPATPCRR